MRISKQALDQITPRIPLQVPSAESFVLPEKILQFGTGVLLRGLPDHFVDQANKQGIFNGRIVVIKSTSHGDTAAFDDQDGLFTLCVRGVEDGQKVERYFLNSAISRVLNARGDWEAILQLAASPDMELIVSNTTETGIQLTEDDIRAKPPASFPGKLLAFLFARYEAFHGDAARGMTIIPTELLTDNGHKLKNILIELAASNGLPEAFVQWLQTHNIFCNSLVDRIVPGKLPTKEARELEEKLGYQDHLLISAEPYRLWAVETPGSETDGKLSFAAADPGMVLSRDISKHRELKLRLLNGTHSFSCGLAFLSGCNTVGEAMETPSVRAFIENLMIREIVPAISGKLIAEQEALSFARQIIDRFSNPYIVHKWLSISVQYTLKMRTRNIPLLEAHYGKSTEPPVGMAQGLAAYLLFMRSEKQPDGSFRGNYGEREYSIEDDYAEILWESWNAYPASPVQAILSDTRLWGMDLSALPGLLESTEACVRKWMEHPITVSR